MSPIRRDEIKQSGAMTPKQEGGSEGNAAPRNPEDDMEEKVRHSNVNITSYIVDYGTHVSYKGVGL